MYCTPAILSLKSQPPSGISSCIEEIARWPNILGAWLLFRTGDSKARVRRRTSQELAWNGDGRGLRQAWL